mmetsp:Transcript_12923/g.54203  ORF Transcript_12923/g.54203 Transcript_12923/m.54203 type:complete len:207 (+) Transcript_12923:93-713(+)
MSSRFARAHLLSSSRHRHALLVCHPSASALRRRALVGDVLFARVLHGGVPPFRRDVVRGKRLHLRLAAARGDVPLGALQRGGRPLVPRVHRRATASRRRRVGIEVRGLEPILRAIRRGTHPMGPRHPGKHLTPLRVVGGLEPLASGCLSAVGVAHVGRATGNLTPVRHAARVRRLASQVARAIGGHLSLRRVRARGDASSRTSDVG